MQKISKTLLMFLFLAFFTSFIHSTDVITSLDFQVSPTAQTAKIGDMILFNMCVLNVSSAYSNVTQIVSVTNTAIVIACANFPATDPSVAAPLWIYNGTNTWRVVVPYENSTIKSVKLENANLYAGRPVSDYNTIQYSTFYGANGVPSTGGTAKIDIGSTICGLIILYDDGAAEHNDASANDGKYNNKFLISEAYKINVVHGAIVGHFNKSGSDATNDPFAAPNTINIDGVRPEIELVNVNPNPFNPYKNFAQFFYYLSENSSVTLKIFYNSTTITTLDADGYFGYNNPILWDGRSNTGSAQTDGDYYYRFDYTDAAGNAGVPFVGVLKITTVDLTTSLYSIDTQYTGTNEAEIVVHIKMDVELHNATTENLRNLGFDYVETFGTHDYRNYPYVFLDLRIYNNLGSLFHTMPRDIADCDTDASYINPSFPTFLDGWTMTGFDNYNNYYRPLPVTPCAVTNTAIYTLPDKDKNNDWDNVFGTVLHDNGGGFYNAHPEYTLYQKNVSPGTYIVSFKAKLVGKNIFNVSSDVEKDSVTCGETTIEYSFYRYHAQPSFFFDETTGYFGGSRGYGLTSEEKTASYMVEPQPTVPVPDNSPPVVVVYSNYPSNGETLAPGVIGTTNYLRITVADDGVGAGPINLSTFTLKDPYGNIVPGKVAWNAGNPGTKTWELYYIPDNSLILGGSYTYSVIPVDAAYNIGQMVTYSFIIADTSIPIVTNVNVQSSTGNSEQLSSSSSRQITFIVSKIQATIIPGGTSSNIDWNNSGISVKSFSGNYVSGTVSHQPNTNTLDFIPLNELVDGNYTVIVTTVSDAGYQGAYSYSFYITTANVTYINLAGTGDNDTTVMRISQISAGETGITSGGVGVDPTDFSAVSINIPDLPMLPANYNVIGTPIRFVLSGHNFPVNFNKNFCSAIIRIHYTDTDVATLNALGLSENNLTVWYYNGTTWQQITDVGGPIDNPLSSDRYLYVDVTSLSSPVINTNSNVYAIMYTRPTTPTVTYNFKNTKSFNPTENNAKILYTTDINSIGPLGGSGNVKVYIFSLTGSVIRTFEYQNPTENILFNNHETDPVTGVLYYYLTWDGRNDHGSIVKNGIYVVKIEITTTDGKKTTKTRTIAVIK
ncbi:MAG: hypothetical protein KA120_01210 [Candidatus Goldbacteria bacterium]|nr:hypothetical protein [Candidatus Goldiibacteriota bacterium]